MSSAAPKERIRARNRFSDTRESHDAKIGPLELSVKEKERVNVPVWAGVALVVAGGALLVVGRK